MRAPIDLCTYILQTYTRWFNLHGAVESRGGLCQHGTCTRPPSHGGSRVCTKQQFASQASNDGLTAIRR